MDRESYLQKLTDLQRKLQGFIIRLHAYPGDREDILQEANLYIIKKYPNFDSSKDFTAWAYSLTRFTILAYRKKISREFQNIDFNSSKTELLLEVGLSSHQDIPYDSEVERLKLLEKIKKTLGRKQLLVFSAFVNGMSVKEICAEYSLKPRTVYSLYCRAKKKARAFLEEYKELKCNERSNP